MTTQRYIAGEANREVLRRILTAEPVLVDLKPAGCAIPYLKDSDFLHSGPPLAGFDEACGALRGSIAGALVRHKRARDVEEAMELARSSNIRLLSANEHHACGTYAGVIAFGTPVIVVENRAFGNRAYTALNEGRGKALRYGANDPETLARLAWLEEEFAEILGAAIRLSGGVRIFDILGQALHMGDEGHSRQKAASALFMNVIAPYVLEAGFGKEEAARALRFLARNEIFHLSLTMAAAKATMEPAEGVDGSSLVTCMAANGVRFGIRVSGLGNEWLTAPVPDVQGRFFEGYRPEHANPMIGDSVIAETMGLGAFAMAGAPALARYVGGTPEQATQLALEMYSITIGEHPNFTVPQLGFRGTPTGIDATLVVKTGLTPIVNIGIGHREPGIGQIGAGYARTPRGCYDAALERLALVGRA